MSETDSRKGEGARRLMFVLQLASFLLIWLFVIGIAVWITNLLMLSFELQDAVGATAAISFVAIPVFVTLAGVLTYVFVGLQKEERRLRGERSGSVLPLIIGFAFGALLSQAGVAQIVELPSDILRGRIVFEEKGCITCHGIGGYGGTSGPDLSSEHYYGSFLELASDVWNHIPEMYRKLRRLRREPPQLSRDETLNLFAFLYSLRYLGEPGSVVRGRQLFDSKGCTACHAVAGRGGDVAPDLASLEQYASPIYMAQTMWNHAPGMLGEIQARGSRFPTLTGQDIVDMSAFIRAGFHQGTVVRMSPGDPNKGRRLFSQKACDRCHSGGADGKEDAPDLSTSAARKSVAEISAMMWNHGPDMADFMAEEQIEWPVFEGSDMADLIAFIYFLGFEDKAGDAGRGSQILSDKGCIVCHKRDATGIAPDFGSIGRIDSPMRMVQLMWNHAPQMEDRLLIRNEPWPKLTKTEMQDIYAFIHQLADEAKKE